jgi:hypothetical protein
MSFLLRKSDGAITLDYANDSETYQKLAAARAANGQPLFEEISPMDVAALSVGVNRIGGIVVPPLATAVAAIVQSRTTFGRSGTITSGVYYADAPGIVGQATNSRTLTVQQVVLTATPARVATVQLTLALVAGVNAPPNQASTAFTVNSAALSLDAQMQVNSAVVGTGLADSGGVVAVTFTPA